MPRDLGSKRHNPDRVFDKWIYKVKDVEYEHREFVEPEDDELEEGRDTRPESERWQMRKTRVKNKLVTLKVIYIKDTRQSEEPPHPTEKVGFEVICDEIEPRLKIEGTDIECLRAAAWEILDEKFAIKWERYFLVTVDKQRPYHADGTGLMFSFDTVHKGTTWDGKFLMKRYDGQEFKIKPWPGEFTDKGGNVMACIPATKENEQALDEFSKRIDILREKLADFLRPENILQTLANLGGIGLLPEPPAVRLGGDVEKPERA